MMHRESDHPDHYRTLQVDPQAEPEVIRAAYRSLAQKYHPDVSGGSHERMAALNEAWAVLKDRVSRATYDRQLAVAQARRSAGLERVAAAEATDGVWAMPSAAPRRSSAGTVLDFGRYAGWSLRQLASEDPDYLHWLARTPIGRPYTAEIDALLAARTSSATATAERPRPGRFRRH